MTRMCLRFIAVEDRFRGRNNAATTSYLSPSKRLHEVVTSCCYKLGESLRLSHSLTLCSFLYGTFIDSILPGKWHVCQLHREAGQAFAQTVVSRASACVHPALHVYLSDARFRRACVSHTDKYTIATAAFSPSLSL